MGTVKIYLLRLILFATLILVSGFILLTLATVNIKFTDVAILTISFFLISFISLIIFFIGRNREPGSRTMYLFVALSLKLLLEMFLALIWFIVGKKTGTISVILFFVLYLAFSLFSIFYMLKSLNDKSL